MDMKKYYDILGSKNNKTLKKKINNEIFLFIIFIIISLALFITIIVLLVIGFVNIINRTGDIRTAGTKLDIIITPLIAILLIVALGMIWYSDIESLKELRKNDRIFAWLWYFINSISNYKTSYIKLSINNLRLILIRNKLLYYLSSIKQNLIDSFIFNKNTEIDLKRIDRFEIAIRKGLSLTFKDSTYKSKLIELLNQTADIYGFFVDGDLNNVMPSNIENKFINLDNKLHEIEEFQTPIISKEDSYISYFKKLNKNYVIIPSVLILGAILLSISFNKNINPVVNNVSSVVTICVAVFTFIYRKK